VIITLLGIIAPLIISSFISLYIYKKNSEKILIQIGLFLSYIIAHLSIYRNITFSPIQSTDYIPFSICIALIFSIILSYKNLNNFSRLIIKIINYTLAIGLSLFTFIKFTWQGNQKLLIPTIVVFLVLLFDYLVNKKQEHNENFDNFLYLFLISLLSSGIAIVSSIASIGQILGAMIAYIFPLLLLSIINKNINVENFNLIFNTLYVIIMLNIYLLSPNEPPIYSMLLILFSPLIFVVVNKKFTKQKRITKIFLKIILLLLVFLTSAILIDNPFEQKEKIEEYNY
jgi:hypothetical protein